MRSGLSGFGLLICALLPSASMAGVRFDVPDYLLQLPQQTYQLIESNFSRLYQQTDFTPRSPTAISTAPISTTSSACPWP